MAFNHLHARAGDPITRPKIWALPHEWRLHPGDYPYGCCEPARRAYGLDVWLMASIVSGHRDRISSALP